jgi:hypothetical protein
MEIIICIFGCISVEKYATQIVKIIETWGEDAVRYNIKYFIFLGEADKDSLSSLNFKEITHKDKFVFLKGVGNDYASAGYKQNLGLKYIYEHHPTLDYVFVCGTDTFVNISKLHWFLSNLHDAIYTPATEIYQHLQRKPRYDKFANDEGRGICFEYLKRTDALYIGGHSCDRVINGENISFHLGGAGFILNRVSLKKIYPYLGTMVEEWKKLNGGVAEYDDACDLCIGFFANVLDFVFLQYWYYFADCCFRGLKRSAFDEDEYYVCCDSRVRHCDIISCHNMNSADIDEFIEILKQNDYYIL